MQNTTTGELEIFDRYEDMLQEKTENPEKWAASFEVGEKVRVINSLGEEGFFKVHTIGKKIISLRTYPKSKFYEGI